MDLERKTRSGKPLSVVQELSPPSLPQKRSREEEEQVFSQDPITKKFTNDPYLPNEEETKIQSIPP